MGTTPQDMSSKGTITIRPRKFLTNRLLQRRQMILDVHHPRMATPDKDTLKNMIAEYLSKAKGHKASPEATVLFGMKTKFGGDRSSCFALVYDSVDAAKQFEPKHRLVSSGHSPRLKLPSPASSARRRRTVRRSSVAPRRRSVSVLPSNNRSVRIIGCCDQSHIIRTDLD